MASHFFFYYLHCPLFLQSSAPFVSKTGGITLCLLFKTPNVLESGKLTVPRKVFTSSRLLQVLILSSYFTWCDNFQVLYGQEACQISSTGPPQLSTLTRRWKSCILTTCQLFCHDGEQEMLEAILTTVNDSFLYFANFMDQISNLLSMLVTFIYSLQRWNLNSSFGLKLLCLITSPS